jgi:molybdate transport system substrate-binding protein
VKQSKVVGSRVDLARSGVALGVRSSAPTADVSSDDKLRAYLLAVRSIEIGNPAGGGFSSVYFTQTLAELGIADALKARIRNSTLNEGIARVSRGEADLTAGMMSEIVPVKELKALQYRASNAGAYLEYAAGGKAGDAAQALVFFLGTQGSKAVFAAQGMEPR